MSHDLSVSNVKPAEMRERAKAAMASVGLSGFDDRLPRELAGGQQQRITLARALVLELAVMLFDEPLLNLDARLRCSMHEEIRSLQQRLSLTVAYVTHDQSEALAVSDQIIVMVIGVMVRAGSPADLYERPQSEFVAGFIGKALLFDGQASTDSTVRMGPLNFKPQHGAQAGRVKVAVRPQAWAVMMRGSNARDLPATVSKSAYLGNTCEYTFDTELGAISEVSPNVEMVYGLGGAVSLRLSRHGLSVVAAQNVFAKVAVNFDSFMSQAWNDHATDSHGVALRLSEQAFALLANEAQLVRLMNLAQHVHGEHLHE